MVPYTKHNHLLEDNYIMTDLTYIAHETIKYYFNDDFSFPLEDSTKINAALLEATTIDEYLVFLIEGYINVTLEDRLEKYFVELIKDDWFHKWPLVRWAYASRLLYNKKASKKDIERAVSILLPLAQEGYPNAMCDIAYCYCYGIELERSYERAMCLWISAAKRGHQRAKEILKWEYEMSRWKELSEELKLFFINRLVWIFVEDHKIRVEGTTLYPDALLPDAAKVWHKMYNEHKKLYKLVCQKAYLRHTGHLCWSNEDNPYSIGLKLK